MTNDLLLARRACLHAGVNGEDGVSQEERRELDDLDDFLAQRAAELKGVVGL